METHHLLEINLISAQSLKTPSTNLRRLQTYALAWVNPSTKLRTRVDILGGENPTWNDKFIFRVSPEFLSSDTSAVSVEIYAVGYLKDPLIGTVRFLVGNCLSSAGGSSPTTGVRIPSFIALHIRRPSGRFHGVLNLGAMVINGSDFAGLAGIPAIGYRVLMGHRHRRHKHLRREQSKKNIREENPVESCDNYSNSCGGDSGEYSDADSSSVSSTSTSSTVLQEWNGRTRDMAVAVEGNIGKEEKGLVDIGGGEGGSPFSGLGFQRKKNQTSMNLSHCYAGLCFGGALV